MPQVLVEAQTTYQSLTPSLLTAYKGLSLLPSDSYNISTGSPVSGVSYETFNPNQGTLCFWYYPYAFGNTGQLRYLFDVYVDANNRISLYIGADNNLTLSITGNGTTRTASTSFAGIVPFTWVHIIATWSINVDVNGTNNLYVYINGSGAGSTTAPTSMTSVPSTFFIGSDYNGKNSANGTLAYRLLRYWMSSAEVTADYNSGSGSTDFVTVTPDCIALGLTSESSTNEKYTHSGQKISTISTVTLTLSEVAGEGWVSGDEVVVFDDASPPNIVRTTINGAPSGTTIVVSDSCASVTGTNKFISRNLVVDSDMSLADTTAWTGSGATLSKNTTTPIADTSDLKILNTGAAQGTATQTLTTIANRDYAIHGLVKGPATVNASSVLVNVDADTSKSITATESGLTAGVTTEVESCFQAGDTSTSLALGSGSVTDTESANWDNVKVMPSHVVNGCMEDPLFINLDLDALYYAQAANGTVHDITTEDFSISARIKIDTDASGTQVITGKYNGSSSAGGYLLQLRVTTGYLAIFFTDKTDYYIIIGNADLRDNVWHHVAAVIDRDNVANSLVYVDGIDVTTTRTGVLANVDSITTTSSYIIGAYSGGATKLDGQVFDVKLAIGTVWSGAEVAYQSANKLAVDASAGTLTDYWAVSSTGTTTLVGLVNNLTLSNVLAWVTTPYVVEANATIATALSPHSGLNCLKVIAGAANVGASQAVTLVTGQYYTITGYAKATAGDTAGIYVDTGNSTIVTIGTTTATSWTRIRGSFKSAGTSGVVYLRAVGNTDIVWFDDISIVKDDVGSGTYVKGTGIIPINQPLLIR